MLGTIMRPLLLWLLRMRAERHARELRTFTGSPLVAGMLQAEAVRSRRDYETAASNAKVLSN